MLPALPTGMHSASSSPARSSTISNAAVFCPSIRKSLTELTSEIGCRFTSSRTSLSASSKFPRSATTRAPCIRACASLPVAILPSGTITAPRNPARAAYAAADAAVFPVEAQMTASAPSRTAADTAQVIPRSLNEPVGLAPSIFSQTSVPAFSDSRSARIRGVEPSFSETTGSPTANGSLSRYRSMMPGMGRRMSEPTVTARRNRADHELPRHARQLAQVEHDLAGRAAAVDQLERVGRLLEREPRAHHLPDEAVLDRGGGRGADLAIGVGVGHDVGAPPGSDHLGVVQQQPVDPDLGDRATG